MTYLFELGKWARTPAVAVIVVFAKEDCDEDEVNVVEAALELDVTEVIVEVIIALLENE